mgnify:FL=1
MSTKEATARIKINKLLEQSGWRFFDDENGVANISLEPNTKITQQQVDAFGENFETTKNGFVDFLLLDEKGFPLIVLEAKKEKIDPLSAKEQARTYAQSLNCRFVILSNGNMHYFWDLKSGSPYVITSFPNPDSIKGYKASKPDVEKLINEVVDNDYIAQTQHPNYAQSASWVNQDERTNFIESNGFRFLRPYQKQAVHAIQKAVAEGKQRFLFEMATGTGKTLTSAAVLKLFFRTGNAKRILFLVDRLELEKQALKDFDFLIKNDCRSIIYKENRSDWRHAEIVITTVQSLLHNNKYQHIFSPTDFDLVVSDEAHRSIGGNARAVFEYFIGYKLGLTATPKNYIKAFNPNRKTKDPKEYERRLMLDTYRTFGCEDTQPTFRYTLLDGVKEGFLINPLVVDARTDITTQLLSEQGLIIEVTNEEGDIQEETFKHRQFEKKFFSETTNTVLCKTFMENALHDPISAEIGKTIIFSVSQSHAAKLTQILNQLADKLYPNKYNSDFAVQVTSQVSDAQQFTMNFQNNILMGSANFIDNYKTSKARVCVTVGMMTTGYDCPDILNLCLMRPIFSPTDFIQIKGRGTRKHNFLVNLHDDSIKELVKNPNKATFKLFDFFGNCEYFETEFDYDEVLKLPKLTESTTGDGEPPISLDEYVNFDPDTLSRIEEQQIGYEGMRIDRMFYDKFENQVKDDPIIKEHIEKGQWDNAVNHANDKHPNDIDKLRKAAGVDRKLGMREIIEKAFGIIDHFKSKDELLEEEFDKFVSDYKPNDADAIMPMKYYFKAYTADAHVRDIITHKNFTDLNTNPSFTMEDFKSVPKDWRQVIPNYVDDYVPIDKFLN